MGIPSSTPIVVVSATDQAERLEREKQDNAAKLVAVNQKLEELKSLNEKDRQDAEEKIRSLERKLEAKDTPQVPRRDSGLGVLYQDQHSEDEPN